MTEFFDNLYNQYKETIYKYILVSLGFNYDLANDCIQDVFVLLLEKKEIIASHPNPGGFFIVTARNYIKRYKTDQYNYAKKIMPLEDNGLQYHDDLQNIYENYPDTETLKSTILQRLSQKELQLYELFYEQQFSVAEIAKRLSITEGNAKVRLFRLRLKVREHVCEIFK
ncbi:MAG: sigma-70 family RNA polymerase sigma factor [Defluviitaleaceae bacterium]|nr:sigma-70 family RNA polymerase sigma factor [Defluviitaleaceae bacterium]